MALQGQRSCCLTSVCRMSLLSVLAFFFMAGAAVGQDINSLLALGQGLDVGGLGSINLPATPSPPPVSTSFCNMTPTWFPKDYENKAFPPPFTLDKQTEGGYPGVGDPYRVAIGAGDIPKLFFGVNWFLLQQTPVPTECMTSLQAMMCGANVIKTDTKKPVAANTAAAALLTGKKLMAATPGAVVLKAIRYDAQWQLSTERLPTKLGTFTPGQTRAPFLIKVVDYNKLDDGEYCIFATATAKARSGTVSINGATYDVPCQAVTAQTKFCFAKVVARPYTRVRYESCNSNFTAYFTGITPRAQYAAIVDGEPKQLFQVVIHLYGNVTKKNLMDDRGPDELPPGATQFVSEYIDVTDPVKDTAMWTTDLLKDGKYYLNVEMLLKAKDAAPLCNLSGPTVTEDGTTYQGWIVNSTKNGKFKPLEVMVYHEKSDVFALECPQDPVTKVPAKREFSWTTAGKGVADCFVDKTLVSSKKQPCESPFTYTLEDRKNHTFTIRFTDICGNIIQKRMIFNAGGCMIDMTGEPPAPPPPPPPAPDAAPSGPLGFLGTGNLTTDLGLGSGTIAAFQFSGLLATVLVILFSMAALL